MKTREIKFRAQHRVTKEWKIFSVPLDLFIAREDELGDYINFSQFTGLKDAKGKDIYEGDLLRMAADGFLPHDIVEVKWDAEVLQGWLPKVSHDTNWLIVGNIYENPDLLTN